jgi:rod shape-determining protein MreC
LSRLRRHQKKFRNAFVLCVLLAPFVFFSSPLRPWLNLQGIQMVGQEILYPFEYVWHEVSSGISLTWREYLAISGAAQENEALKRKLSQLEVRVMDREQWMSEALRLRQLLHISQRSEDPLLVGEVVGNHKHLLSFPTLRVDRGTADGVQPGMPVMGEKGVVGQIIRTGLHFSDIQMIEDHNFYLDVLVERTRIRGVLHGVGNGMCRLQVHRQADLRIGDTVVTSGLVGTFPKGFPIGSVMKISYETDEISQVITIAPTVDFRQLEEVMILLRPSSVLETIRETAGPSWMENILQ